MKTGEQHRVNTPIRNIALLILFVVSLIFSGNVQAQEKSKRQRESLLTARKWTLLDVKKNKLTKLKKTDGFRMEEGNELSFSIDHKFGYKNNDYAYMSGKWILDGKSLLLIHDSREATNRLENSHYKVIRLTKTELFIKKLDKPKGKLRFK